MEKSYREWERERRGDRNGSGKQRKRRPKATLGIREKRRIAQLLICLGLFTVVFAGQGVSSERASDLRQMLRRTLRTDTDFHAVFTRAGEHLAEGVPLSKTVEVAVTEVFSGVEIAIGGRTDGRLYCRERNYLSETPKQEQKADHWLPIREKPPEKKESDWYKAGPVPLPFRLPAPVPAPKPAVPAVVHVEYSGPDLPDNVTMDRYNLSVIGVGKTAAPASGWLTSGFGWRKHPVDGRMRFHNGIDLGMNTGTAVAAFADGTVDYIGESPIYGKYLQLKHAGGLTSFYAHCSRLCVSKGAAVSVGQKIAESGATGNVTGPHLHFELKLNGTRLNPAYYISTD